MSLSLPRPPSLCINKEHAAALNPNVQYRVLPLAGSPELAPDTLILYAEPDLVLTIGHSVRLAIDFHNAQRARERAEEAAQYSEDEVKAYAELYRRWLTASRWYKEQGKREEAAWPTYLELDEEGKKVMEFLYRPRGDDSGEWVKERLEKPNNVRPDELRPEAMSKFLSDVIRTVNQCHRLGGGGFIQMGWHARYDSKSALSVTWEEASPNTGGHFLAFTTYAARQAIPVIFQHKEGTDLHMGRIVNNVIHGQRKTMEGTSFLKPPIGSTFAHSSETTAGFVAAAQWGEGWTSEGTDTSVAAPPPRDREVMRWRRDFKRIRSIGKIDLADGHILRDMWYTQLPPNSDVSQCGVKKYHIGYEGEDAKDAAEIEDFANLGDSAQTAYERPHVLGICRSAQDNYARTRQRSEAHGAAAKAGKRAADLHPDDLREAVKDPLEVLPEERTERTRRKARRRVLQYCMRIFSADHYDTCWRQPMAINIAPLEHRVVQTGARMAMTSDSVRKLSKQPGPPSSAVDRSLAAALAAREPLDRDEVEEVLGPDHEFGSGAASSSDARPATVKLAHAGHRDKTKGDRTWSGNAEADKRVVRAGGSVEPRRAQPSPAPHMDKHILQHKAPPIAGSVARAPVPKVPVERFVPKVKAHDAIPPWRQVPASPRGGRAAPVLLPLQPKQPPERQPHDFSRYLDPSQMQWV